MLLACQKVGQPFGSIVQFLALTGQRRDEVGQITWDQIDLERAAWVIPAEHAKNGKPHVVHLSESARNFLTGMPQAGGLVFTTDGQKPFQG